MFELSEEQILIRDSASRFLEEAVPFAQRQATCETDDGYDSELWQACAEMGWLGIVVPEEDGGLGGSIVDAALIQQQMGKQLVRSPWLQHSVTAATGLALGVSDPEHFECLVSGTRIYTTGLFENDHCTHVETAGRTEGESIVVNGCKRLVPWAAQANRALISARMDDTIRLLCVDPHSDGVKLRPYRMYDGSRAADMELNDVRIDGSDILGAVNESDIQQMVDRETALLAAEASSLMWAIHHQALEYLKTREQFGTTLGSFQALQHRMVDVYVNCELAQSLAEDAILAANEANSTDAVRRIAAAKAWIGEAGRDVGKEGIQLHGGIGMTNDIPIGHYFKRLSAISRLNGDSDWQRNRFAGLNGVS